MMNKKIKILAITNTPGAVAQIRINSPLSYLQSKGYVDFETIYLSKQEDNTINYVPDIVILQRLNNLVYFNFINLLKSKGSKIVFELDDNLLELPKRNPAYNLFSNPTHKRAFLEYIWLADHLIVSTQNLKDYYHDYNKSISVIPNQIDKNIFCNDKISKTNASCIRIGFAGTTTHQEDFEQVVPALQEIKSNYSKNIKLVFIDMLPEEFVRDNTIEYIPGVNSLHEFSRILQNAKLDIGLAPLSYNKFNMAKSDIKFLEYGLSGIAGIYSNFGPYKHSIEDAKTGLLVDLENSNEWYSKIEYLINNPLEIDKIKQNAYNYVSENRTIGDNYKNWLNVFNELTNNKLFKISKDSNTENKYDLKVLPADIQKKDKLIKSHISIITLTYNQLEYTQKFIESIFNYTEDFELIIVDNNSTDGTRAYLNKLKNKHSNIKVILNGENYGFPKAINQALNIANGKFIVLTNNDIIVTQNWLDKLVSVAESDDNIGIVGPISNFVSGVQLDQNAKYNSIEQMHKYSDKVSQQNKGEKKEFPRVAFLCTLIKKEVIDKIGGLDERFSPGNFEDDDFCLRAQLAGFKTVIAKDVFIHHYGSVSFKAKGENEYAKRLETNKNIFIQKWGTDPEGIWLRGENIKKREIKFSINPDDFIQSFERALINIEEEEYDLAIINLKIALKCFDASNRKGYENITKTELLNLAGTISLSKNEIDIAKNYFEEELTINPNSSTACYGLGEIFNRLGMFENAKTMYEWAVANDINNLNAKSRLVEVNTKLNLPLEHNSLMEENIKK